MATKKTVKEAVKVKECPYCGQKIEEEKICPKCFASLPKGDK